jgi:hypothetical protein
MACASIEPLLASDGFAVLPQLLPDQDIREITARLGQLDESPAGTRTLLAQPWCAALGERICRDPRLSAVLPCDARVVQCTLFDKRLSCNWLVTLHQDLSIPVASRVTSPLCGGWSCKEGVLYVQPPVTVLEDLLAVRLHLDDCDEGNGALRAVPGSHRLGRLKPSEAQRQREARGEQLLPVARGGALLMRPLLLHSSSKALRDSPRRVLHFLLGPAGLPEGLRW